MEADLKNGGGGDSSPKLLDLIPSEIDWIVRDRGGKEGGNDFGLAEEKELELRLGPPGRVDWLQLKDKKEELFVPSLGFFPLVSKITTGAKRGFLDTLETKTEVLQQQQKPGFLHFQSIGGLGKEMPQDTDDMKADQQQQSLESIPCSTPKSANAAAANNSSKTRTVAAPVVGWPPIRSSRKNLAGSSSKLPPAPQNGVSAKVDSHGNCNKGLFVKINMDGIPIGRKVDLRAYDSYEKLSCVVDELFRDLLAVQKDNPSESQAQTDERQAIKGLIDGTGEYTLIYEDNEGDRLLAGDVPWEMFVSTVKRLRVLKSSELSALSLVSVNMKRATQLSGDQ